MPRPIRKLRLSIIDDNSRVDLEATVTGVRWSQQELLDELSERLSNALVALPGLSVKRGRVRVG